MVILDYVKLWNQRVVKTLRTRFINALRVNPSWKLSFLLQFSIGRLFEDHTPSKYVWYMFAGQRDFSSWHLWGNHCSDKWLLIPTLFMKWQHKKILRTIRYWYEQIEQKCIFRGSSSIVTEHLMFIWHWLSCFCFCLFIVRKYLKSFKRYSKQTPIIDLAQGIPLVCSPKSMINVLIGFFRINFSNFNSSSSPLSKIKLYG